MPLVTILSPCYNGEKYLARFLVSILNQTYSNIEFIFVDDGSEDNTKQIFDEYVPKFKAKKYKVKYIYQENKGQAAAVNKGLKHVSGKYLAWPDSDDELLPTSIEKKVKFLEENSKFNVVFSQANAIDEETNKVIYKFFLKDENIAKRDLIADYLTETNIYVCNGTYLVNFHEFKRLNNGLEIFEGDAGQNWQILLPFAIKNKIGYIPEILYNYYYKKDSHSNLGNDFEDKMIIKYGKYQELFIKMVKKLGVYSEYEKLIEEVYIKKRLKVYFKFYNKKEFIKEYNLLKERKKVNKKIVLLKIIISNKVIYSIINKTYALIK